MPIRVAQENVQPRWVHGKRPEIAGAAWSHSAAAAAAGVDAADEVAAEEPAAGVARAESAALHTVINYFNHFQHFLISVNDLELEESAEWH